MADHRRNYEDSDPRRHDRNWADRARDEVRSWFGDDDSRRHRGNDERDDRHPYGGDRTSRYDPARGYASYGDDRSTRWEGPRDDPRHADYGYPGASTGAYRTDDRPYHERFRYREDPPYDRDEPGRYGGGWSGRFRYPHGTDAARVYYRAARDQRDDYQRWSADSDGAEWTEEGRGRDEGPSWGRRERGGYWRQYDRPLTQSPYYGRGPKDYQRPDDRVREEVCDAMTDDPLLDASEITVTVAHGEVTLTGSVTTRDQKRRAEDVAERISGVKDVTNQLRVAQPGGHAHTATQPVTQASGQGTPSKSSGTSA
jgi:osmotically-inducible protein OsmY